MNITQKLMTSLADNTSPTVADSPLLRGHAKKNKVLLQYLRAVAIDDDQRQTQEQGLKKIYNALIELASQISHLDYAVIKFFKPIAYLPSDIDLLLKKDHLPNLSRILHALGYRETVSEPNCVTFEGKAVVDVYLNPDAFNVPYIDGALLLNYTSTTKIAGITVKKLQSDAEVVIVASHAVYKEQIITLNDYYFIKSSLSTTSFEIAKKCHVCDALDYVVEVFEAVENGKVNLPFKIGVGRSSKFFLQKITVDSFSRKSLPLVCFKILDGRLSTLVRCRLRRQTY
ncbi:MAG: nucleotidyltransferase family protein [Candidatus Bathyarchaeota archaeon]|nr:nucleotidyltransferase family protein [Candidatus Bathyarchaeota archaeon]